MKRETIETLQLGTIIKVRWKKYFKNLYADSESPVEAQEEGLTQLAVGIVIKIIFINVLTPCTLDGH